MSDEIHIEPADLYTTADLINRGMQPKCNETPAKIVGWKYRRRSVVRYYWRLGQAQPVSGSRPKADWDWWNEDEC